MITFGETAGFSSGSPATARYRRTNLCDDLNFYKRFPFEFPARKRLKSATRPMNIKRPTSDMLKSGLIALIKRRQDVFQEGRARESQTRTGQQWSVLGTLRHRRH
ncbi:hypothetical protein GWI33_013929 [Rhynchophorus ferrugineus]|uniref:Uncharacterized protein n=1 Tax=Rhynchophorus ferrugineus TaxID=354439 RepID=A0A834MCU0_RHYFE|nr:hypothetical protein GWI33_013929 [Rhynchophorus ferrugineus]